MTRRKPKHKKPTHGELDKMERIKSLLESEGSKVNTVPIVQSKIELKHVNPTHIKYKNISMPLKDIIVSEHAINKGIKRLGIKDKDVIKGQLKNLLRDGKPIGETYDENGNPAILFAKDNYGIYVSPDLTTIVTIIPQEKTYPSVRNKVVQFLKKEVIKLDREEKRKAKELTELKLVTNIEIAELEYEIYKRSKDKAFANAATARINAIKQTISEYHAEILNLQKEKTHTSKSIIAYNQK